MRIVTLCTLVLLSCCALHAASKSADDWPNLRGPDSSTGVIPAADWLKKWNGAKTVWEAQIGVGFSSIAISQGIAVSMGNSNNQDSVIALDAKTGTKIWSYEYPCQLDPNLYEGGPNATPTIDGKVVYTFSKEGHVFCFELKTGKKIWQRHIAQDHKLPKPRWGFSSSPLVMKNFLILNAGTHGIALDKRNGKTAWQSGKGTAGYASVVPYTYKGKPSVLVFAGKELYCVDAASGKSIWKQGWRTNYDVNAAVPIPVGKDQVFVASGYGVGCGLLAPSGRVYANKNMQCQQNGGVLIGDHIYGIDAHNGNPGHLVCIDPKDGSKKWSQGGFGQGSVIAVGTKLLVLSDRGLLAMVEATPTGYEELGRQQILKNKTWTQPAVANGFLYARDAKGHAICLDIR